MENEEWRTVRGYEGLYEVSNNGRVKSVDREIYHPTVKKQTLKGRIMSPTTTHNGYHRIGLRKEGAQLGHPVHRLVAIAFIPNPEDKDQINHKNGIKDDNRVENLEWCTHRENMDHAMENNLRAIGDRNFNTKLSTEQVLEIRSLYATGKISQRALAAKYKVAKNAIKQITQRKSWKHI